MPLESQHDGAIATIVNGVGVEPVNITMVTYNRVDFTRRSIESIASTAGYPYELTVVDNGSRDSTVELLRDLEARGAIHRLILNTENRGVAYAANQGWAAGGKAHYMKVDNDIVFVKPGWLVRMVEACDALSDVGVIAYNFESASYPVKLVRGVAVRPKQGNVGGACAMIPGRAHQLVGYWCEDYWPYSEEDFDLFVRLRAVGLQSYYMEDEDVGLHLPEGKASPLLHGGRSSLFDESDPEYRAEKNRWRSLHAGRRGLRRINGSLYKHGLRPVFVEHGASFRPGLAARLFVLARYGRINPWGNPGALPGKEP